MWFFCLPKLEPEKISLGRSRTSFAGFKDPRASRYITRELRECRDLGQFQYICTPTTSVRLTSFNHSMNKKIFPSSEIRDIIYLTWSPSSSITWFNFQSLSSHWFLHTIQIIQSQVSEKFSPMSTSKLTSLLWLAKTIKFHFQSINIVALT
jgi:hypothetical protein